MKNRILIPWLMAMMIAALAAGAALADIEGGDDHPWGGDAETVLEGDEHPWGGDDAETVLEGDEHPWDSEATGELEAAAAESLLLVEQLIFFALFL